MVLLPSLMTGVIATIIFIFNTVNWKISVDKRISSNRCDFLLEKLTSRQTDYSYSLSAERANSINTDYLEYHVKVSKESHKLLNEINGINKEREKLNC